MTDSPQAIARKLSPEQVLALSSEGREGNVRGLVRRGLLQYRWGNSPGFGYLLSGLGRAVLREVGSRGDIQ